jgi:hypothetical protein
MKLPVWSHSAMGTQHKVSRCRLRDLQHQGPFEHELVEVNAFFSKPPTDPAVNIYKLKLWEFFSEISSPQSLGQLKIRNGNPSQEIFSAVPTDHWKRLLGEIV